jgi:hypothetical protein
VCMDVVGWEVRLLFMFGKQEFLMPLSKNLESQSFFFDN